MFIVELLAVAFLVGFFAIPVYWGSQIDKTNLQIEIMRRQKDLGKPIFDDIDFEKYRSIKELSRLNEELKSLQRIEKAKEGSLPWYEGVTPVRGKVAQEQKFEYVDFEEPQEALIPLNWDLSIVEQGKVDVDRKKRDRRIQEVNRLEEKVDSYFKNCFGRNVIEGFNTKISWGEAEFFIKLALKRGSIEEYALEAIKGDLESIFQTSSLEVTGYENIIRITFKTSEIEFPSPHYMFSKFASEGVPKTPLTIMAGIDKEGRVRQYDLAMAGGVLVCGKVGSGKSNFVRQTLSSIMLHSTPDEAKFVVYNPYVDMEFNYLKGSPYLYTDLLSKEEETLNVLAELKSEIDRRWKLFSEREVCNISDFNSIADEKEKLPYLLVTLMEAESLLYNKYDEVIELLVSLTTRGRATGVILLETTYNARADIVPQRLKANLPCVIAYSLGNSVESMVAIGTVGAERLLVSECLIKWIDSPEPTKIKTPYINDTDIAKMVDSTTKKFSQ
jgi:ftsK/spoIIIE family protein